MSEASENEFMNIAHQALEDAGGVKCSKEEYSDGLDIIVAEIAVSQEAVRHELEEEGKALAEPDDDEPKPLPDVSPQPVDDADEEEEGD